MNTIRQNLDHLRAELLNSIDSTSNGRKALRLKTLLRKFGYSATYRVRDSSLTTVLATLASWGIGHSLPAVVSTDAYITIYRLQEPVAKPIESTPVTPIVQAPSSTDEAPSPIPARLGDIAPLAVLFRIDAAADEAQARLAAIDLQNAVWALHPILLLVDASDELFAFACGYFAALLRRRALTVRAFDRGWPALTTPEIVNVGWLKRMLGHGDLTYALTEPFPMPGAVYILRQDPEDLEDDDLVGTIRDCLLPHTYQLIARPGLRADVQVNGTAENAPILLELQRWIAAFAGSQHIVLPPLDQHFDLSRLLSEAVQSRDALLGRKLLGAVDPAFRSGFESSEHMGLKSLLLNGLRRLYPNEEILVEELTQPKDISADDVSQLDRPRRDKPDLRIGDKLWVEVETLRGLALRGSNPFFELESKLRLKLNGMRSVKDIWLMVPNDIALLAATHLSVVVRNLNQALGVAKIRWGFVDLLTEQPVFLDASAPPEQGMLRLVGISLRSEPERADQPKTWDDVAGYSDIRERLQDDILDPLLHPEKYRSHGLTTSHGVLLYGLPGCGKSLIGRVLAGEAGMACRYVMPSDLSSMWLHESVTKTRELFDWALKHAPSLLIIDELDAVASQRKEANMHTDEKRQVNEILAQLDRVAGKNVIVVATTNYLRGIDSAVQRSGRFDIKLPVFPPDEIDRRAIFGHYLSPARLTGFDGLEDLDTADLAAQATLFAPVDIKTVVETVARRSIRHAPIGQKPRLTMDELHSAIRSHPRSIQRDMAASWADEVTGDLGAHDPKIVWLREEIERAYR